MRQTLLILVLVTAVAAQDKWVWSGNRRITDSSDRRYDQQKRPSYNDRYEEARDRYDVTEPTTKRPQADEFYNDYGDIDDLRYNQYPPKYAPGAIPYPPQGNLQPNPANGILVGPGGPTGIIGRPPIGGGNALKGHPANGILVGPGGPTGIIGRPPHLSVTGNVGPQVFPGATNAQQPNQYPRPGLYPGAGVSPLPGAYPGGPVYPGPGAFPPGAGAYPHGAGAYPPGAGGYPLGPIYPGRPGYPQPGQIPYPGNPAIRPNQGYYLTHIGPGVTPYKRNGNPNEPYAHAYDDYEDRSNKNRDSTKSLEKNILKKSIDDKLEKRI